MVSMAWSSGAGGRLPVNLISELCERASPIVVTVHLCWANGNAGHGYHGDGKLPAGGSGASARRAVEPGPAPSSRFRPGPKDGDDPGTTRLSDPAGLNRLNYHLSSCRQTVPPREPSSVANS